MAIPGDPKTMPFNGYYRTASAEEDKELTHVGPGTPCGEYLRCFWHPVALSSQLHDLPLAIRVLGEDLVLFRDLGGRTGLLHKHCSHRRASLEYGIITERGIRCCYHGWLYDVDGRILETPGEPAQSNIKDHLSHGAYPTKEYKGLVFTYMGAPEKTPAFPIYDTFELPDNDMVPYVIDYPCNWLQVAENPMDPFHSVFLHTRVTRAHFNPAWGAMPVVEWHRMKDMTGIYLTNTRRWEDYIWVRTAEWLAPNFAQPPDIFQNPNREKFFTRVGISKWTVPIDNTHCKIIAWRHYNETLDTAGRGDRDMVGLNKVDFVGQTGVERSSEEAQRMPGDYEAQISQGPINVHASEHLATTDTGIAMMRRMLRDAIRAVRKGEDPPRPQPTAEGLIPTTAGDVIVRATNSNIADDELQRELGRKVGYIVVDTMALGHGDRRAEIARRVGQLFA